jgi:hypothetical protein
MAALQRRQGKKAARRVAPCLRLWPDRRIKGRGRGGLVPERHDGDLAHLKYRRERMAEVDAPEV